MEGIVKLNYGVKVGLKCGGIDRVLVGKGPGSSKGRM